MILKRKLTATIVSMKQEFIAENKEVGKGRQEKHQNKIKI